MRTLKNFLCRSRSFPLHILWGNLMTSYFAGRAQPWVGSYIKTSYFKTDLQWRKTCWKTTRFPKQTTGKRNYHTERHYSGRKTTPIQINYANRRFYTFSGKRISIMRITAEPLTPENDETDLKCSNATRVGKLRLTWLIERQENDCFGTSGGQYVWKESSSEILIWASASIWTMN